MQKPNTPLHPSPTLPPSTTTNKQSNLQNNNYHIDVIQVSNIALAIKNKEHTINIELSVRLENLPILKTFGSTNVLVAIYKSNENYEYTNDDYEGRSGRIVEGQYEGGEYQGDEVINGDFKSRERDRNSFKKERHYQNSPFSGSSSPQQKNRHSSSPFASGHKNLHSNSSKGKTNSKHPRDKKSHFHHHPTSSPHHSTNHHNHPQQWLQIGRTQIIYNQPNPKFIKTFVFSYNQQKQQKIQFRIYDIINYNHLDNLNEQNKIGTVTKGMDEVVENDHGQFQIQFQNKKKHKSSILKTNCTQYDSGNSKYEIGLELSNFVGKIQVFYIIEVLKLNEWIPISRSENIEIKQKQKFQQTQISYSKFPSQDNSRVKIKIFQISKNNSHHQEEIGSTDELTIINILTTDDKIQSQRVYKNGFVVGVIKINKWRKVIRDSFISYIVNGATLHLILGIDFSVSNAKPKEEGEGVEQQLQQQREEMQKESSNGNRKYQQTQNNSKSGKSDHRATNQSFQPTHTTNSSNSHANSNPNSTSTSTPLNPSYGLHKIINGTNPYIQGIRKIIGVLQYFDYYNQIALYGFGAKLPPYYKNVGQCFALNGNYFNPIVVGGVQQIIKHYKQNLQKNKLHGPTKLSQMIDLAIEYAQSQQNTSNYYVLVLMTDGQINDYNETAQSIIKASSLPLSIIIVGIGNGDFTQIKMLDSDQELLKSPYDENIQCQRDIVDFIKLDRFNFDKTDITLARETFAQIPSQFIEYMMKKNIKPNREKKSLKAAKQDFISEKIKESKNISTGRGVMGTTGQKESSYSQLASNTSTTNYPHHINNNPNKPIVVIPQFLEFKKKRMKKQLISLGFDSQDPLLKQLNIAMNDLSYFIEVHSYMKKINLHHKNDSLNSTDDLMIDKGDILVRHDQNNKKYITIKQKINQKEEKILEEYLDRKENQNKKKILEKLEKIQTNQYGRIIKSIKPKVQEVKVIQKHLKHPCLECRENQINIMHFQCGHLAVCEKCATKRCVICKYENFKYVNIDPYREDIEDSSDSESDEDWGSDHKDGY